MAFTKLISLTRPVGYRLRVAVHDVAQLQVTGPRLELLLGVDAAVGKILMVKIMVNGRKIRRLLYLLGRWIDLDPDILGRQ